MGALVVNNNIMAINTNRHLKINSRGLGTNLERLSSGLRINRGADDPSGLQVSEGFRAEIGGLMTGTRNAEHGTNLIQTAEGGTERGERHSAENAGIGGSVGFFDRE